MMRGDLGSALIERIGGFESSPHVGVAVSGGSDSMALALLVYDWSKRHNGRVSALVVDHRTHPLSATIARKAAYDLENQGIESHVLSLSDCITTGNRQDYWRSKRFDLMANWCRNQAVMHLFLGHQRQDQVETFFMRLARGSGVEGLSAMVPVSWRNDVRIIRPLLMVDRYDLRLFLKSRGLEWVDDPSNLDQHYARVRWRRSYNILVEEGLTWPRIQRTLVHMHQARIGLLRQALPCASSLLGLYPQGYASMDYDGFMAIEFDIGLYLLAEVVMTIAGRSTRPRYNGLRATMAQISNGLTVTLMGCLIQCRQIKHKKTIVIGREPSAIKDVLPIDARHWDGRFSTFWSGAKSDRLQWRALGVQGWTQLCRRCPQVRGLYPWPVPLTWPAIFDDDRLVEVPIIGLALDTISRGKVIFHPPRPLLPWLSRDME